MGQRLACVKSPSKAVSEVASLDSRPVLLPAPTQVCVLSLGPHIPVLGSRALAQHGQLLMVGDEVVLVFHGSGLWSSPQLLLLLLLSPASSRVSGTLSPRSLLEVGAGEESDSSTGGHSAHLADVEVKATKLEIPHSGEAAFHGAG